MKAAPEASVREALGRGLEHQRAGRLPEAEAMYRQALQAAPDHPDALHLLGAVAHQAGRNDLAIELSRRSVAMDPSNPHYLGQLAFVLQAGGNPEEAIACYRRALAIDPRSPELHFHLALALGAQGHRAEAMAGYREALRLEPGHSDARNNLGLELQAMGRLDEALVCFRSAVASRPGNAPAHNNLGNVLDALGDAQAALASYQRALELEDLPAFQANFARLLRMIDRVPGDASFRHLVARAISEPWARPADLARAGLSLVKADRDLGQYIDAALRAWPAKPARQALLGASGFAVLARNPLLRAILESLQVCDLEMERFLNLVRHGMLEEAMQDDGRGAADEESLALCCALARQCFINDYVFSCTDEETGRARSLRAKLVAAMESGREVSAFQMAAAAAYFPLGSLPFADLLPARPWPAPVAALLTQQVVELREEQEYGRALPRLTGIDEGVSRSVQRQYEENPYPKWVKLPHCAAASPGLHPSLEAALGAAFGERGDIDILVAGCGTGQESIELARRFPRAKVLAIDLSLASLAYAERKAHELAVANLEHAQADIMSLGSFDRRFDLVSSVGVLHHLERPLAGWRHLAALLRPGGLMLVGLYSERGREDVVAARKLIAERGYGSSAEDIRRCRQELMSSGDHADLALRGDFFGTSECRDLLFHVQEHRYRLPGVGEMLRELGLEFLGFGLDSPVLDRFRRRFPEGGSERDLDRWDAFEAENPRTFSGMYVFWVRKPPDAPTPPAP